MKEHFVCTFLLHCGEWAERGKNGRKGRSEQTSDWWQMLLVAEAYTELREREGKYATLSARLGMRGEGQEERGLDRTQVSGLCLVQLDEWRLFSRL